MRRFITKLAVFLAPILIMVVVVEYRLRSVPNDYMTKRAYLERSIDRIQILVVGSSHAERGVLPQRLGAPAFSIAYGSQDVYYDNKILSAYLPRAKNLKLVLVPMSLFSFWGKLDESVEAWRTSYYYHFWGIPPASRRLSLADYSLIALYGIPETRRLLWNGFRPTHPIEIDEAGGDTRLRVTNLKTVMDASVPLERHSAMKPENIAENRRYFEEMLDALKARGIRAVLFTTPCFRTYYEKMSPEVYRLMQDEVQRLRQKYGLDYYNYLTDPRFGVEDFSDSDHLSTKGAEKFTEILRDEVVKKYIE